MGEIDNILIHSSESIREGFKQQSLNKKKFVVVHDDSGAVMGVVTDGDFRRAIWNSISLERPIVEIVNTNFVYFSGTYDIGMIAEVFSKKDLNQIPVLHDDGSLRNIIFREDYQALNVDSSKFSKDVPVVIMAGGKGARLDPFTRILPKPLIPIDDKPIIEIIMEKFYNAGANNFYVSLNHKGRMIKVYLEDCAGNYEIVYIEEDKPLGTVGALKFLEGKVSSSFIVTNCDIIVKDDYLKIKEFHDSGNFAMTIVGAMQHHVIPYGVCNISSAGDLESLTEKPSFDALVNTGMYVCEPSIFDYIPKDTKYDMDDLIPVLKKNGHLIGIYPIAEKSWIDIGQWEAYKKNVDSLTLSKEVDRR